MTAFRQGLGICQKLVRIQPGNLQYAVELARDAAFVGEDDLAWTELDRLAQRKDLTTSLLFELAKATALAAEAASFREAPDQERQLVSDRYATRALQLLARAREAGYFQHASALAYLEKDRDFDILRPRTEFKQLLERLKDSLIAAESQRIR
jgi:hypothetical protein